MYKVALGFFIQHILTCPIAGETISGLHTDDQVVQGEKSAFLQTLALKDEYKTDFE